METVPARFTQADYALLPEGFPAQLVGGGLVKEVPPDYGHQLFAGRIRRDLVALLGVERVPDSPIEVLIDDVNVFWPDVVAIAKPVGLSQRHVGIPLLVVEVLSASTEGRDRGYKVRRYLRAGVGEVWLVDRRTQTIEVHERTGVRAATGDQEIVSRAVDGFRVVPAALFAPPDA